MTTVITMMTPHISPMIIAGRYDVSLLFSLNVVPVNSRPQEQNKDINSNGNSNSNNTSL